MQARASVGMVPRAPRSIERGDTGWRLMASFRLIAISWRNAAFPGSGAQPVSWSYGTLWQKGSRELREAYAKKRDARFDHQHLANDLLRSYISCGF